MRKLRKSAQNDQILFCVALIICLGFGLTGCQATDSSGQPLAESSDTKLATEKVLEAEPLYAGREELAKARVAVAALRQAHEADTKNFEAAWKLARAAYYVGDHTDDSSERDDMFRDGIEAGSAARKLQPEKPEGHFWFGANVGGKAVHSTLANPTSFQDVRNAMEVVLKVDEGFQSGSAYMALGRLYMEAPGLIGGDNNKAISYLEKGLRFGPNNSLLHAYLAEAYEAAGRDADARKQIEIVNSSTPEPQYTAEHKDALARVKKVEKRLQSR